MTELATTSGSGEVRRNLDPLTTRFPAIGEPVAATWLSGTFGSDVPGPSTYWIDAVVSLEPSVADVLRDEHGLEPAATQPEVSEELADEVPTELLRSESLDAAVSTNGFTAEAFLAADDDVLVLVAIGE